MRISPVLLLMSAPAWACLNPEDITPVLLDESLYLPHPEPVLEATIERADGVTEYHYSHAVDGWWAPAGETRARGFAVTTPPGHSGFAPVLVVLHGGCGTYTDALGTMPQEFTSVVIYLEDSNDVLGQPCRRAGKIHHLGSFSGGGFSGVFVPYALRRQSFERDWAMAEHQGDPAEVRVIGHSKGGAGALYHALLEPEVYASAFADVPRVNLAVRVPESLQPCDVDARGYLSRLDTALLMEEDPRTRDVHIFAWLGRDDLAARWCYAFGACEGNQQGTEGRWWDRARPYLAGFVWDESGHDRGRFGVCDRADSADPVLGCRWQDTGWEPPVRKDLSWPKFSGFGADADPGGWVDSSFCQGAVATAGDTGCWNGGELAGAINRGLRWSNVLEGPRFWAATIWIESSGASGVPGSSCVETAGYPYCFDNYAGGEQSVTVSPRQLQDLFPVPGEVLSWQMRERGAVVESGQITVSIDGSIAAPVTVSAAKRRLRISR
jgi:hypothetical protein